MAVATRHPRSTGDRPRDLRRQLGREERQQRTVACVLAEDPALGEQLDAAAFAAASRQSAARTLLLREWPQGGAAIAAPPGSLGFLVLRGMLARCITVDGRTCTELVSSGDVIRPWREERERAVSMPASVEWRVLEPLDVAVIDRAFIQRMEPWPEVLVALADRLVERTRALGYALAVGGRVSVADRVELTVRDYADRWGRVTAEGIVVELPGVTHELLGSLVGAARPSVTTALSVLRRRGTVLRLEDERWLVAGDYGSTRPRRIA